MTAADSRFKPLTPSDFEPRWGACPRCGDSLQNERVNLGDHGMQIDVDLAWCQDCLRVRGEHVVDEINRRHQADD